MTQVDFLKLARKLRFEGMDWEEVLQRLRDAGATIIDSVKIVRELDAVRLGSAKEVVDASRAWSDRYEYNQALRKMLIEALESDQDSSGSEER